jgi:hypothetical protein
MKRAILSTKSRVNVNPLRAAPEAPEVHVIPKDTKWIVSQSSSGVA